MNTPKPDLPHNLWTDDELQAKLNELLSKDLLTKEEFDEQKHILKEKAIREKEFKTNAYKNAMLGAIARIVTRNQSHGTGNVLSAHLQSKKSESEKKSNTTNQN